MKAAGRNAINEVSQGLKPSGINPARTRTCEGPHYPYTGQNRFLERPVKATESPAGHGAPEGALFHYTLLLQNDLVAFLQTGQDFGLGAVGNSDGERDLAHAVFAFGIGHFG